MKISRRSKKRMWYLRPPGAGHPLPLAEGFDILQFGQRWIAADFHGSLPESPALSRLRGEGTRAVRRQGAAGFQRAQIRRSARIAIGDAR